MVFHYIFQKNCRKHENWRSRRKVHVHFAKRKRSVRLMLTCVNVPKKKIREKYAKKMMRKINQNAARAHIVQINQQQANKFSSAFRITN